MKLEQLQLFDITPGSSFEIRSNIIKNALIFVKDSFGFGVGTGNAEYYLKNFFVYPTYSIVKVHNWWIEILFEYGLLIFLGYLMVYFINLYFLFKIYKNSQNRERMISEALICSLIVFPLASISPSSIISLGYFWLIFAFSIGFINNHFQQQKP